LGKCFQEFVSRFAAEKPGFAEKSVWHRHLSAKNRHLQNQCFIFDFLRQYLQQNSVFGKE